MDDNCQGLCTNHDEVHKSEVDSPLQPLMRSNVTALGTLGVACLTRLSLMSCETREKYVVCSEPFLHAKVRVNKYLTRI